MAITGIKPKKFLIVDFSASLTHTHHKQHIYGFCELLTENKFEYEVWIPYGSSIPPKNLNIRRRILPGTHMAKFELSYPKTWIPSILAKLYIFAESNNFDILLRIFVNLISGFFCARIICTYRNMNTHLVFTTSCPFAIKSIRMLEKIRFHAAVYCRLTNTAEKRGCISKIYNYDKFINDSRNFKYIKTNFGFETQAYYNTYRNYKNDNFYISPTPTIFHYPLKKANSRNLTFSILGYPTHNKGIEFVQPLIQKVLILKPSINWIVQVQEFNSLTFTSPNENLKILKGKISSELMHQSLLETDLLCLPYNSSAFAFNASTMMYSSMDYLIPVITFNGTAFASDINQFNCGVTVSGIDEMIEKLIKIDIEQIKIWANGCKKYNAYRNMSNKQFLNLG
jgi:hypothetical protein